MKPLVVAALVLCACQDKATTSAFSFEHKFKTDSTRTVGPPHDKTATLADAMPRLEVKGAASAIVDAMRSELEGNALVKRGNVVVELASPLTVDLPSGSTIVDLKVHGAFIDAPNVIVIDASVKGPLTYSGADAKLFGKHLAQQVGHVLEKEKVPANAGPPAGKPAPAITIGSGQPSCTVHEDKSVRCWHRGESPMLVPKAAGTIAIDGGQNYGACGLRADGTVYCIDAGNSSNLELADVCGVTGAKAISIGDNTGCALLGDGTVKCWGGKKEWFAPCGTRSAVTISGITGATAMYAGPFRGAALMADGSVRVWEHCGKDCKSGVVGEVDVAPVARPLKGIAKATAVSSGFATCAAIGTTVVCTDQDGKKTTTKLPEAAVELVHAKGDCARTASGKVFCFHGDKVEEAKLSGVTDIDGDLAGLCAITTHAGVACAGGFDGTDTDPPVPVKFAL